MRVIVAGGGTGGHVIPALAIAQELRSRYHAQVLFVGTQRGIETRLVPAAGFELHLIQVGALNRVDLATRLKTLLDLPRAFMESAKLIREFRPDVMIGVGGYASGPAMLTAAMMSVPTIAFEPNVIPGFANRMIAPMVSAAAVHFEATCHYFRNCHVTGVPVRQEFFHVPARATVRSKDARPTLLMFGGSQGAHAINQAVLDALPKLMEAVPGIHVIHQTGETDYVPAQAVYLRTMISAEVSPFIDDMPGAFARADLLVCRSGASTVAEITAAGKPAIFVPLPTAADDHQTQNAATLADGGAARLLPQSELSSDRLVSEIAELLRDRPRLAAMAEAARRFAHPDAAARIAALAARAAGVQSQHAVA
ncbi:MAG: undecaprenyldiphospho-muramoylpentapeptide beta-N-acetylglucosaminyltransferase [Candidatus Korobacteraceae bacterium]|jgi:UDP-N-acetylglucosamine--N-acetylmuramyl-(pentapeptide) pyrophosphoryl-undecaprenol N-acetylglucosamine transferase